MKLFFRKYGSGRPLIILHGLFGQSDNWNTLAKQFSEQGASAGLSTGLEVYTVDQRNHGLSPHSEEWNYKVMSEDVLELINDNGLNHVILLGHSMGGKTAMRLAFDHPQVLSKLIVADIGLKKYEGNNDSALQGLLAVDLEKVKTRKDAEEKMSEYISDYGTKQFLLKNLHRTDEGRYEWRFNLEVIAKKYEESGAEIKGDAPCSVSTLFIRGSRSNYIKDEDIPVLRRSFPNSSVETVEGSGHWVHAEKPEEFFETVMRFVKS